MNTDTSAPSEKLEQQLKQIKQSTLSAIGYAEQNSLGQMMQDTNTIINTLNSMISEVSTARRIAVNRQHQAGITYRKMADEIGISYQRVAEIAKGANK